MPTLIKLIPLTFACAFALTACDRKPASTETVKDKIDDALDRRPAEGVRDAAEDLGDAVEDARKNVSKNLKEVTR